MLKDAIAAKDPADQYFEYADAAKFNSENAKRELQTYINAKDTTDQWNSLSIILKAVIRNKDTEARRSMSKALSETEIKKAGNFAENLLKGQIAKQFNDLAAGEKDPVAKGNITTIAGKIK